MKNKTLFQLEALLIAATFSFVSCEKENASSNKPPYADAGRDTTIMLPDDNANLDGNASYDPDGKISKFLWRKILGANVSIADWQSSKTNAKNLSPGNYQFELSVTDNGGLSSKDTMAVTVITPVQPTSPSDFINLTWIFPWSAALEIRNIYSYVPQGKPFKVFIQRDSNPTWLEVPSLSFTTNNHPYEYFIETRFSGAGIYNYGSLYIFYYGTDTDDTPNVKVEF